MGTNTHVERINLLVQLVDTDALYGSTPLMGVFPHEDGLLEIIMARAEKAAAWESKQQRVSRK